MIARGYFIANDYDLAFNLQKLFHEYVALYTRLHFPDKKTVLSNADRRELNAQIQDCANSISLLTLKMKQLQAENEIEAGHFCPTSRYPCVSY